MGHSLPHQSPGLTVCHIASSHQADDVRIFQRECRSLAEQGHYRVVLVAPGTLPDGTAVEHVAIPAARSGRVRRWVSGMLNASRGAASVTADIYHVHDPEMVPYALLQSWRGRRVIWDAHEDYATRYRRDADPSKLKRASGWLVSRVIEAGLSLVDTKSAGVVAATATIGTRYGNPRTVVVGNEARLSDLAQSRPSSNSRRVLFTGAPEPGHLFDVVVEAVARVPELTLTVARRTISSPMDELARRKLGDRYEFVGFLDRDALANAISASLVGLCTYAPLPCYLDSTGSPTKFYEFAAAGLPVVGSPIPTLNALMADSGAGVSTRDFSPESLSSALRNVMTESEVWEAMSAAGRSWAQQNDLWAASEQRLIDLYDRILPDGGGDPIADVRFPSDNRG